MARPAPGLWVIGAAVETCDPDPPRGSALVARPALGLWGLAAAAERSGSCPPYRSCESPRGSGPPRAAALREQRPRGAAAYPHGAAFLLPGNNHICSKHRVLLLCIVYINVPLPWVTAEL